jgi:hypothetical protein
MIATFGSGFGCCCGLASTTPEEQDPCAEHEQETEQADDRKTARLEREGNPRDQQDQTQHE